MCRCFNRLRLSSHSLSATAWSHQPPLGLLLAIEMVRDRILRDCDWQRHGWKIHEEGSGPGWAGQYLPPDNTGTKITGMQAAIRYIFRYCPPTRISPTTMLKRLYVFIRICSHLFSFNYALISCGLTQSVGRSVSPVSQSRQSVSRIIFMYVHMAVSLPASYTLLQCELVQ